MMKRAVWVAMVIALVSVFGCNSKGNQPVPAGPATQKVNPPEASKDRELAVRFLQGVQNGDKKTMYEAENLTEELVEESREKLIHPAKYNLTDGQRIDFEHVLRMSGGTDFFIKKLNRMFPRSATFQIIQTTAKGASATSRDSVHDVKITYGSKAEAMSDKTGKPVKEMTVQLQHKVRLINGRWLHEISFSSTDFDKIADRDFSVRSYF